MEDKPLETRVRNTMVRIDPVARLMKRYEKFLQEHPSKRFNLQELAASARAYLEGCKGSESAWAVINLYPPEISEMESYMKAVEGRGLH